MSNTGQADDNGLRNDIDWAMPFTTGPGQDGFKLTRVDIALRISNIKDPTYAVSIRSDSEGRPDSSLGTLTNPTWTGHSQVAQHTASGGGIDLANGTTYWVVVDVTDTNRIVFPWSYSNSLNEDAGKSLGWSIGNTRLLRTDGDWTPASRGAHRIAIRGYSKDTTLPTFKSGAVNRATLTMIFTEALDPGYLPPGSNFDLILESGSRIFGTGTASISGDTVTVTLEKALTPSDEVGRASYFPPTENGLRDGTGNLAIAQASTTVANITPPVVQAATVSGATLSLAFDAVLDAGAAPDAVRFAVAGTDQATTVSGVAFAGGATKLELTLSPAVGAGDTGITLSYAKGDDDSPLRNGAGNEVADFAGLAVANLMAMPAVSGVAFTNKPQGTYRTIGAHIEVTATFDQPVTVSGTPQIELSPAFGPGGETRYAEYVSGSSGTALVFRYTLVEGDHTGDSSVSVPANGLDADGADGTASIRTGTMDAVTEHAAADSGLAVAAVRPRVTKARAAPAPTADADLDGTGDTYVKDDSILVVLSFDDDIAVTDYGDGENARIVVAMGGTDYTLNFAWQYSVTDSMVFGPHTVVAGDKDLDGITVKRDAGGNLLRLSGTATIKGKDTGNDADLSAAADLAIDAGSGLAGDEKVPAQVRGTNAAPTGSEFTKTTASDTGLAFAAADFEIDDSEDDPLGGIRITSLPAAAAGTLREGTAPITSVVLPYTVTHTRLNAGDLAFHPVLTFSGSASFSFTVVDSLGAAAASANTATLNVFRRPAAVSASVDGSLLKVGFDRALDTGSVPDAGRFAVAGTDQATTVSGVAFASGDATTLELTLSPAVGAGDTGITLSYAKGDDDSPLQDGAGREVADFAGLAVANLMAMPAVSGVAFTNKPAGAYRTIGAHIEVTVTFDQPLTVSGTPRIELSPAFGPGGETRYAEYVSGSSETALVFRYTLVKGDHTGDSSVSVPANGLDADGADGTASIRAGTMDAVTEHAAADSGLSVAAVGPGITNAIALPAPTADADLDGTGDTYVKDDSFYVVLIFGDSITVADSGPSGVNAQIVVAVGGTDYTLNFFGHNDDRIGFRTHVVVAADQDLDGITVKRDTDGNLLRLSGTATVTATDTGNPADLSAAADLAIDVGSGTPGAAFVPARVRGTNAAPTGSDFTKTTAAGAGLAFAAADFEIDDSEDDPLKEIRIASLPAAAAGTLKLGGTAIAQAALPQTVTPTQLNAGSLVFDPVPTFSGSASFSFTVVDSLGAAAASANMATLNVFKRPAAVSASVNGSLLKVTFDTALDAASRPAPGAFSVAASGSGLQAPTAVAIERDKVSLTLGTAVAAGETVVLGYLEPAAGSGPLQDAAGVAAASFAGLQVTNVTGDTTAPEVVQAWVDGATLKMQFSEALDPGSAPTGSSFALTGGQAGTVNGTGTAGIAGATVTVTLQTAVVGGVTVGNARYVRPNASPLQDLAGNLAAATLSIPATNVTGDTIAPQLVGTPTVNATALSLTFNEAMDPESLPDAGDFAVTVNGVGASLAETNSVAIDGAAVTLTLATAVPSTGGQAVTVGYTPGTNPLQDLAGNDAASLTAQTVLNAGDMTGPKFVSAAVNGTALTITFNEPLDESVTPLAGALQIFRGSDPTAGPVASFDGISGPTVTATLAAAAGHGTVIRVSYSQSTDPAEQIKDLSGNVLVNTDLSLKPVTNNTPPAYSSSSVNGDELTITFDGGLATDAGSLPAGSDFAVTVGGEAASLAATAPVVSGSTVTLALAEAVLRIDTLTVAYTPGTNKLKDADGAMHAVPGFTAQAVTNDTPADTTGPKFVSAVVNGTALTITFNEPLDESVTPLAGALQIFRGSDPTAGPVASFDGISGPTVTATLAAAAGHGTVIRVSYSQSTDPAEQIKDLSGNVLVNTDLSLKPVTNNTPPAYSSSAVNGDELTITFDGGLATDAGSLPAGTDFAVTVGGEAASLADTAPVVSGSTVTLTLAAAVLRIDTLTVAYTPGANKLKAAANAMQEVPGFSGKAVTNNTPEDKEPPSRVSTTVNGQTVTVTFDEDLDTSVTMDANRFSHRIGSGNLQLATGISIARRTVTVTLATAARHGQEVGLRYTVVADTSKNLKDRSGNQVPPTHINALWAVTNNTPPAYSSSSVNGDELTITFDGGLATDAGSLPAGSDFAVTVGGEAASLAATDPVEVSGSTVTLALAEAVLSIDTLTVGYTPGANKLKAAANAMQEVPGFSGKAVTNDTPADTRVPEFASAAVNGVTRKLTLTFDEDLKATAVPLLGRFSVAVNGGSNLNLSTRATSIGIDGPTVTITLGGAIQVAHGTGLTVTYLFNQNEVGLQDLSGNFVGSFVRQAVTNNTPPAYSSSSVHGDELTITFNGGLATDAGSLPAGRDFAVTVGGEAASLADTAPVVSGSTVTLVLAEAVLRIDTLTVGYTPGTNRLKDADNAMEEVPGFSAQAVTNDTPADTTVPKFSSAAVNGLTRKLTLTFDEDLKATAVPSLGRFSVAVNGGSNLNLSTRATSIGIDGPTVTITLGGAINVAHGTGLTVTYLWNQNEVGLQDLSGNLAGSFVRQAVTNNTPPAYSSSSVNGDELTITFNGGLATDAGSLPAGTDFAVTVGGEAASLADTAPVVSGSTVTLVLAEAVLRIDTLTVGYTPGTNRLKDADNAMEEVPGFSAQAVTNDTPADTTVPKFSSAAVNGLTRKLTLTIDEDLKATAVPSLGRFSVAVNGGSNLNLSTRATSIGIDGPTVTITLGGAINVAHGTGLTVTYLWNQNLVGLQDLSGNFVGSFVRQAVTNNTPPAYSSSSVNGDELTITFNGGLDESAAGRPALTRFTVKRTREGTESTLSLTDPVAVSGSQVTLTLAEAVQSIDTVTVAYTAGGDANPLRDADHALNEVPDFAAQTATNDTPQDPTRPTVTGIDFAGDAPRDADRDGSGDSYRGGDVIEVEVTFSGAVEVTGTPTLKLDVGGAERAAAYQSGSDSATLAFRYTVVAGDADADGVSVPANPIVVPTGASIVDSVGPLTLDYGGRAADGSRKVDAVAPTRSGSIAFNKANGSAGRGDELRFTVFFSEPVNVTGTPTVDLTLTKGAETQNRVAGYAGRSGSHGLVFSHTVAMADRGDTALFSLSSLANGSIVDAVGNAFVAAGSGTWSVTVDGSQEGTDDVAPLVMSLALSSTATFDADNDGTNDTYRFGDPIEVSVTFSEAVTANTTDGTPSLALQVGTGAAKAASYASGSGTKTLVFRYTVAAGDEDVDGVSVAAGSIALNGGTLKDAAGNAASLAHDALAPNALHKVTGDTTRPTVTSAAINGANRPVTLAVTFDESLENAAQHQNTSFLLIVDGAAGRSQNVSVSGDTATATFAANDWVRHGQTLTMDYEVPTDPAQRIKDLSGNEVLPFSARGVTNNTPPQFSSAAVNGDRLEITFDGGLATDAGSLPAGTDFAVTVGGNAADLAATTPVAVSGRTVTLTLAEAVLRVNAVTVAYTPGTNKLKDADGAMHEVPGFSAQAVTNNTPADTTKPSLAGAAINGGTLTVSFDEELDEASVPTEGFGVTIAGTSLPIASIDGIAGATLTLTMQSDRHARHGQAVQVAYGKPTSGSKLQDRSGNEVDTFLNNPVTNNTPPVFSSAAVSRGWLTITFSGGLDEAAVTAGTAFSVTATPAGGSARTTAGKDTAVISGDTATVSLASAVVQGETVTVSYTAPEANPLRDADNAKNPVPNFSGQTVTNGTAPPPVVQAATVEGTALTVTFDGALDEGSTPAGSVFTVSGGRTGTGMVELDGAVATVTLDGSVEHGEEVTLSYAPAGAPLQDSVGNRVVAFTDAPLANNTPDTAGPTLSSATVNGTALTLTFSETLNTTAPAATRFAVSATPDGGTARTISGTGSVTISADRVSVTLESAVAEGETVTASYAKGTDASPLKDAGDNEADDFSGKAVTNVTGDTKPPGVSGAQVSGATLTITFDEALNTGSTPQLNSFFVTVDADDFFQRSNQGPQFPSGVAVDGSTVTLTLAAAVRADQSVQVSYVRKSGPQLRDLAGNPADSFTDRDVDNVTDDTTPPTFSRAAVKGSALTVTFSEALKTGTGPAAKRFTLSIPTSAGGVRTVRGTGTALIAGATVNVKLTGAVADNETGITLGYAKGDDANPLQDADANKVVDFSGKPVTNDTGDTTKPTLQSGVVNGTALLLTFTENLNTAAPDASRFTVTATPESGTARTLTGTGTVSISTDTVSVTLDAAVAEGETATAAYAQGNDANPLQDVAANKVADFSGQALDNLDNDMTAPSIVSAAVKGATLTMVFDEDLDTQWLPAGSNFQIGFASGDPIAGTGTASISGDTVTVTLATAVTASAPAALATYTPPDNNWLRDRAGNKVGTSHTAVTNNTPSRAVSSVAFTSAPTGVLAYSTIGEPVEVTVTFTEEVTVTGTPRIELSPAFGPNGETRYAVYDSGSPGEALVFRYTLAEGDTSGGTLVSVAANALDADGADGSATIRVDAVDVSPDHAAAASALPVEVLRPEIVTAYVHPAPKVDANLDGVPDTFTLDDDNKSFEVRVHFRNDVWHMVVENDDPSGNIQVKVAIDRGTADEEADLDYSSVHLGVLRFGPYSVTAADADTDGIKILREAGGKLVRLSGMPTPTIKASRRAGGNPADLATDTDLGVRVGPDATVLARVRASNAAPAGMDFTRNTGRDASLAFAKQDFAIADSDGDPLKEIRIATLPEAAEGVLLLGGTAIATTMLPKTVTHTELNAGSLTFDPASAFEGDTGFTFHVVDSFRAASASANTATIRVTTNSAAAFAADSISFSIAENNADAATVGTVTATDAESDTLTYSLASGGDNDSFTIDSGDGTIKVKSGVTLDYETQSSYTVTARVSDGKDSDGNVEQTATIDDTITVTITVTDADEAVGPDVTASFSSVPTTHDGSAAFKARIKFSEAVTITDETTFKDHSVEVLGGTVTDADRLGGDSWEITAAPAGGGAVVVRVLATASCANQGAVCTSDGSRLVEAVEAIVLGPDTAIVTIAPVSASITEGEDAAFQLRRTGGTGPALTVGLSVTGGGDFISGSPPQSAAFLAGEATASLNIPTEDDAVLEAGALLTVELSADSASPPAYVLGSATRAVLQVSDNDGGAAPPPLPGASGGTTVRRKPLPLQLALWTDKPAYLPGETVRLYHTLHPHDDGGRYRVFAWLEPAEGEGRRYLAPLSADGALHPQPVDIRGLPGHASRARSLPRADRALAFEGEGLAPGPWRFVLELRPGADYEQYQETDEPLLTRRAWASFTVAERSQLLNRRNFDREIRDDLTFSSDTIYFLRHQLFVHDGATLTIEPGTVVRAWGPHTAIIVELEWRGFRGQLR